MGVKVMAGHEISFIAVGGRRKAAERTDAENWRGESRCLGANLVVVFTVKQRWSHSAGFFCWRAVCAGEQEVL